MSSKWLSNEGATGRVKALLGQAGVPLEMEVQEVCAGFIDKYTSDDIYIFSDKIVYSPPDAEDEYREVDRVVQIYEEIEVGTFSGVQTSMSIPIECKHRKDVELFSFPSSEIKIHNRFPIYGDFYGSKFFDALKRKNIFPPLSKSDGSSVVLLYIKGGSTPRKIHDENLIYKAAGSLYDFILSDIRMFLTPGSINTESIVDDIQLFDKFQAIVDDKPYNWKHKFKRWISSIDNNDLDSFNKQFFESRRLYHLILNSYLPIVCINGPIYRVVWSESSGIQSFDEIQYCFTAIRKRGWPGVAHDSLVNRRPEVPVVVTNAKHIASVLDIGFKWFEATSKILKNVSSEIIDRSELEATLFRKALKHYSGGRRRFYRSDYDWLDIEE